MHGDHSKRQPDPAIPWLIGVLVFLLTLGLGVFVWARFFA